MRVLSSRVTASGYLVLVRLPDGAAFTATYADDTTERDVTAFAANLLLTGALDALEVADSGRPEPAEAVEAARVQYLAAAPVLGAEPAAPSFSWAHLPSGEAGDFPAQDVLRLLARGLSVELTAAVATEAAAAEANALDGCASSDEPGERA